MTDRVTVRRAAELTGYTEKAIRVKIERGVWPQGLVWDYAPDGRILISQRGYDAWAGDQVFAQLETASRSISDTRGSGAGNG